MGLFLFLGCGRQDAARNPPLLLPGRGRVNIVGREGVFPKSLKMENAVIDTVEMMTPQDALVAVMVAVSASDEDLRTSELVAIQRIVNHLPVFAEYDLDRLRKVTQTVLDLFADEDGLDLFFTMVREALPERLFETAYALACDVAAADGKLYDAELALLLEIRDELAIDRLHAAAIERGARARHLGV